ncbi:MAG TPA: hypothetical protein VFG47_10475 [Geminicoccaceae bacterium]|nr:hypothetical protein [Geminicoccaceae bacterium]
MPTSPILLLTRDLASLAAGLGLLGLLAPGPLQRPPAGWTFALIEGLHAAEEAPAPGEGEEGAIGPVVHLPPPGAAHRGGCAPVPRRDRPTARGTPRPATEAADAAPGDPKAAIRPGAAAETRDHPTVRVLVACPDGGAYVVRGRPTRP